MPPVPKVGSRSQAAAHRGSGTTATPTAHASRSSAQSAWLNRTAAELQLVTVPPGIIVSPVAEAAHARDPRGEARASALRIRRPPIAILLSELKEQAIVYDAGSVGSNVSPRARDHGGTGRARGLRYCGAVGPGILPPAAE